MSYVDAIVEAFGGVRPMAGAVGRSASTVMSWKARGSIPDSHKPDILAIARGLNLGLSEADFFPVAKSTDGDPPASEGAAA